ncbi:MAG: glycosyltransferase family 39 protein [Saprospiraceae bacterium]|nr:glycosyltransferase family 39 protein [Saprospiraceae bacterium]
MPTPFNRPIQGQVFKPPIGDFNFEFTWRRWLALTGFIGILLVQFLIGLDRLPTRLWDESRQAINVIEMIHNENYLVTHFDGQPDLWNTKPPLMIWSQLALSKSIGFSEWSIRLPSAIAGVFTSILIFLFIYHVSGSFWVGITGGLLLPGIAHYNGFHAARTGDYDAMLTLWTTAFIMSFFMFLRNRGLIWLYIFSVALILAILTKGIAPLMFMPGLAFVLVIHRRFDILVSPHFYVNVLLVILIIAGYYVAREIASDGYLAAVWANEVGGRYNTTIENHRGPWWFYLEFLYRSEPVLLFLATMGLALGIRHSGRRLSGHIRDLTIMTITFLIIISLAGTKLNWYLVPIYPLLVMMATLGVYALWQDISRPALRTKLVLACGLLVAGLNIYVFLTNLHLDERQDEYSIYEAGHLIQDAGEGRTELEGFDVSFKGYLPHLWVDLYIANQKGSDISFKSLENLDTVDKVFVWQEDLIAALETKGADLVGKNDRGIHFYRMGSSISQEGE